MMLSRFPLKMKKCGKFSVQGGLGFSCGEALQGHGLQGFTICPGFLLEAALWGFGFWDFGFWWVSFGISSQSMWGKRESSGDPGVTALGQREYSQSGWFGDEEKLKMD